jgi:hypothetical protein
MRVISAARGGLMPSGAADTADASDRAREAGEAPAWLLLTLMTAGLAIVLWGIAGPAYELISHAGFVSPPSSGPQPAQVGFHRHD